MHRLPSLIDEFAKQGMLLRTLKNDYGEGVQNINLDKIFNRNYLFRDNTMSHMLFILWYSFNDFNMNDWCRCLKRIASPAPPVLTHLDHALCIA